MSTKNAVLGRDEDGFGTDPVSLRWHKHLSITDQAPMPLPSLMEPLMGTQASRVLILGCTIVLVATSAFTLGFFRLKSSWAAAAAAAADGPKHPAAVRDTSASYGFSSVSSSSSSSSSSFYSSYSSFGDASTAHTTVVVTGLGALLLIAMVARSMTAEEARAYQQRLVLYTPDQIDEMVADEKQQQQQKQQKQQEQKQKQEQKQELGREGRGEEEASTLTVLKSTLAWLREYVVQPCKALGRPGPVCPFARYILTGPASSSSSKDTYCQEPTAAKRGEAGVRIAVVPERLPLHGIIQLVRDFVPRFRTLNPVRRRPDDIGAATLLVLPWLDPHKQAPLTLMQACERLQDELLPLGLTISAYYITCNVLSVMQNNSSRGDGGGCSDSSSSSSSSSNAVFPRRSPYPVLLLRWLVPGDVVFLGGNKQHLETYLDVFADVSSTTRGPGAEAMRQYLALAQDALADLRLHSG